MAENCRLSRQQTPSEASVAHPIDEKELLQVVAVAQRAGEAIMVIYATDFEVETKEPDGGLEERRPPPGLESKVDVRPPLGVDVGDALRRTPPRG